MDDVVNSFTETTNESFGSRIKGSCGGICIGMILFVGSFPFLFWNEGRAVDRYETLEEGQLNTVEVTASGIDPANDGNLIHFVSQISSNGSNLTDPVFGVSSTDLILRRSTSMYQWQESTSTETRNKVGGGTETVTTYDYGKTWSTSLISSSSFRYPDDHRNPTTLPYGSLVLEQDPITAGEFVLPEEVIQRLTWFSPLFQSEWDTSLFADQELGNATDVLNNRDGYYIGAFANSDENRPNVGDIRVQFSTVEPRVISVVAQQKGKNLQRWQARESDGSILLFEQGNFTSAEMFAKAEAENQATTWTFRFLGFLIMAIGIYLIMSPIQVFADVIPILGDIVGCGLCTVSVVFAMFFSGITISLAWLVHHPMIGGFVLLGFVLLTVGIFYILKQRKSEGSNSPLPDKMEQVSQNTPHQEEQDIEIAPEKEEDIPVVVAEEIPFGQALDAPKPYVPTTKPYVQ